MSLFPTIVAHTWCHTPRVSFATTTHPTTIPCYVTLAFIFIRSPPDMEKEEQKDLVYTPEVWGPHVWFVLHLLAHTYPHHPNAITQKQMYEWIQQLPRWIPNASMASRMEHLLTQHPVQPSLENRAALIRWMHTLHNYINRHLEKRELSLEEAEYQFQRAFVSMTDKQERKWKAWLWDSLVGLCIGYLLYAMYDGKRK